MRINKMITKEKCFIFYLIFNQFFKDMCKDQFREIVCGYLGWKG